MKKKMDDLTKAKLIYSGELMIFAIAFLVIAILKFTLVIPYNELRHTILNWITVFGSTWVVIDFLWALLSKKRRPRISLVDKILHLPAGIYIFAFDLYCLIAKPTDPIVFQCGFPIVLSYLALCYGFESVYHFYHPIPGLMDAVVEVEVPDTENKEDSSSEEQPKEEEKKDE